MDGKFIHRVFNTLKDSEIFSHSVDLITSVVSDLKRFFLGRGVFVCSHKEINLIISES